MCIYEPVGKKYSIGIFLLTHQYLDIHMKKHNFLNRHGWRDTRHGSCLFPSTEAGEQRKGFVPSGKIGFLCKLAPKGSFPGPFLVTRHDPVKIIFVPVSRYLSGASQGTGACALISHPGARL